MDALESEYSWAWGGKEELHKFFPFAPSLLIKSDRFIRQNFIYWDMVQRTDEADEEISSYEDVGEAFVRENEENEMDCEVLQSLEEQHFGVNEDSVHQPVRMPSRIRLSMSPEPVY